MGNNYKYAVNYIYEVKLSDFFRVRAADNLRVVEQKKLVVMKL